MSDLQIFNNDEVSKIKEIENNFMDTFLGVFYALEWGNMLKIGQSTRPYTRLMSLMRTAEGYANVHIGRICISIAHTNYRENEGKLHTHFSEERIAGTELFNISLDEFLLSIHDAGVDYKDESEKLRMRSEAFSETVKKFIGTPSIPNCNTCKFKVSHQTLAELIDAVQILTDRLDAMIVQQKPPFLCIPLPDSESERRQVVDPSLAPENRGW